MNTTRGLLEEILEEAATIVEKGDVSALKNISFSSVINLSTENHYCTLLYIACDRGHLEIDVNYI